MPPAPPPVERWDGLAPRARSTAVGRHRIHSLEFGEGEQAVVLLHGLSGSGYWWRRNVGAFSERYCVVLPDLLGFGSSPARDRLPPLADTAELLADWMQRLRLPRAHLVGHSMGGQIAVHLAARHPELLDRLVLVDPAGVPRPMTPGYAVRFALDMTPLWRWGDPRFFPTMLRDAWKAGPRTVVAALSHILRDDVRPLLPQIQAPTLVLWGERDSLIPLSDALVFRESIPRSQLAVLRGAAHNPMIDRPADFNRLVLRFLDGSDVGR